MIFIYNDYGGTHTTSLAAAIHLHLINPNNELITKEDILSVPFFNKLTKNDFGKLIYHGKDRKGNLVYTLGRKRQKLVVPSLKEFGDLLINQFQIQERIIFSNTSPTVPLPMSLGGFFSRGLKIDSIGVPLLVMGAKQSIFNIQQLVENTKQIALSPSNEKIMILENEKYQI